jgi:hypothetical protein
VGESPSLSSQANVQAHGGHTVLAGHTVNGLTLAINCLESFGITEASNDVANAFRSADKVFTKLHDLHFRVKLTGSLNRFGYLCLFDSEHWPLSPLLVGAFNLKKSIARYALKVNRML